MLSYCAGKKKMNKMMIKMFRKVLKLTHNPISAILELIRGRFKALSYVWAPHIYIYIYIQTSVCAILIPVNFLFCLR